MRKICNVCFIEKDLKKDFYFRSTKGYGYYDKICKKCYSLKRKNQYSSILTPQNYIDCENFYKFNITTRNKDEFWVFIDAQDFEIVSRYRWNIDKEGYVYSPINNGKKTQLRLHRLILEPPDNMVVDHINHNPLDNRRSNLRVCTARENSRNKRKWKIDGQSKYKGVVPLKHGKFRANIYCLEERIYIGVFDTEIEAAKAYNEKAKELFGEFAKLNEF